MGYQPAITAGNKVLGQFLLFCALQQQVEQGARSIGLPVQLTSTECLGKADVG